MAEKLQRQQNAFGKGGNCLRNCRPRNHFTVCLTPPDKSTAAVSKKPRTYQIIFITPFCLKSGKPFYVRFKPPRHMPAPVIESSIYDGEVYLEQSVRNGCVLHVVPDIICLVCERTGIPIEGNSGSCAWADAATIIPWTLYVFYGDKAMLREQHRNMHDWTEYLIREDEAHGSPRLRLWDFHFADWLALDNPDKESCFGATDAFYVASAYYYWSVRLTSKAAAVLGYTQDQARYEILSQEIKHAITQEYFMATGRLAVPTQTGMALALAMDLVPAQFRARLVSNLSKKLANDNGRDNCIRFALRIVVSYTSNNK